MAEAMARSERRDADFFHLLCHPVAEVGGADAGAVAAEEQCGFGGQVGKEWSGFCQIADQPRCGAFADRKQATFAAFATTHEQGAGVGIEIAVVEVGHFGAADASGVEKFQDGAVAQVLRAELM